MNIICFGFGQVAKNFIKKLKDQGASFKLTTTSREESKTKEFENIKSLMDEASELVEPYSKKTAEDLAEMAQTDLTEQTESAITETIQNLSNQKRRKNINY